MNLKKSLSIIVTLAMIFTLMIPAAVSSEERSRAPRMGDAEEVTESIPEEADDAEIGEDADEEEPADETPEDEDLADETPADETPSDETPVDEAPAEEAAGNETPADEVPGEETPAEEGQEDETVFENGYVMVSAGTDVYRDANKNDRIGAFNEASVVYAVMTAKAADMQNSWLKISFDTESVKEKGEQPVTGYIQFKSVTVLSEEEVSQLIGELTSEGARELDGQLLPTALFTADTDEEVLAGEAPAEEEEVGPDEEILGDEDVETDASVSITAQPADVLAAIGETAVFSVTATGTGLTYRWQTKVSATADWSNTSIAGYKTASLHFTVAAAHNNRQYRCVVTDSNGNSVISKAATLRLPVPLEITSQPEDVTVPVGGTAIFTVEAVGNGLSYRWQTKVSADADWTNTSLSGYKTASLHFTVAAAHNNRQYRCVVTDSNGNMVTSEAATLRLEIPLEITKQPGDVTVPVGGVAAFTVEAVGNGLTYRWQTKVSADADWSYTSLSGYKTATLRFSVKAVHNNRQYRCVVTDSNGNSVTSEAATLRLDIPLEITTQPESVTISTGEYATFTVVAAGTGMTYQWQVRTSATADWGNTSLSGNKTAVLKFKTVNAHDGRQFRCIVTDAAGNTVASDPATLTLLWKKTVDGVTYQQIDATTCKVVSYTGTASSLTIPTTVDGKEVKEIGVEAFMDNTTLTSICLPNTITVIRARAFKNCTNLSSMTTH